MHVLICAVSSSRQPSGICRHAANLARCLAGRQEVSAVTLLVGEWQIRYFASAFGLGHPKLQLVEVDAHLGALRRNAWYMRGLPADTTRHRPDILHLAFPMPLMRSAISCPVVVSLHDLYPYDIPLNFGRFRVYFNRLFLRQSLRNSDAVVCSSDFTLNRLRALGPKGIEAKSLRIYLSVELAGSERPSMPNIKNRRFILSVAQHRRNKNLELLLRGYAELRRRGALQDDVPLVVVGKNGPETPRLHQIVRQLGLYERVIFRSSVTDNELYWLYRECDLFLATSSIEGFGLPVVEALQCGARVVCSTIPSFQEIAAGAAQFFDLQASSPVNSIADAATACIGQARPQPAALERFSQQAIAEQYISLYSRLLMAGNRRLHESRQFSTSKALPEDGYSS